MVCVGLIAFVLNLGEAQFSARKPITLYLLFPIVPVFLASNMFNSGDCLYSVCINTQATFSCGYIDFSGQVVVEVEQYLI